MKTKIKRVFVLAMAVFMFAAILSPTNVEAKEKLNVGKKTMYVGQTCQLKVTGTKKKVKWSSDNKKVATVTSKGNVTAKRTGKAKITAKIGKKKIYCKITVNKFPYGKDIGQGEMYISTENGTSENGKVPKINSGKNTILIQIGINAWGFDDKHKSYIYVDDKRVGKEKLCDTQTSLNLTGKMLKKGKHRISVVQYKSNKEGGKIITYKEAKYKIIY